MANGSTAANLKSLASLAAFLSGTQADPEQLKDVRSFFGYMRASNQGQSRLAWYETLFEMAPQAYLITDALGFIRDANATAVEKFGIDLESLVGLPLKFLLPDEEIVFTLFPEEETCPAAYVSKFQFEFQLAKKPHYYVRGSVTQAYDSQAKSMCFLWLLDLEFDTLEPLPFIRTSETASASMSQD